ncbi:MAG: AI-2E family transporter, partial [Vulcanimicrobiaceae bacterium]
DVSRVVGGFVRAQVVVSALVGVLVYIVLAASGIKFAFIIALMTAVFDLVPYLGGIVAFIPSLLFALAAGGVTRALIVLVLLLAVFEFEAQVLAPQIVGARTGLAPSLVVVVLLIGGALFGIFGLFLAVPIAAGVAAAISAFHKVSAK